MEKVQAYRFILREETLFVKIVQQKGGYNHAPIVDIYTILKTWRLADAAVVQLNPRINFAVNISMLKILLLNLGDRQNTIVDTVSAQ